VPRPSRSVKREKERLARRRTLAVEHAVFEKLALLKEEREPYRGLARRIIETTLDRYPPRPDGPIVEIGAGDGQLRPLLPEALSARVVHTEPTSRGVAEIRRRFPTAGVEQATVEELPFADGEIAAAIGLCVLDLVDDPKEAVRELFRVLQPGAPVIHFLDQSPFLKSIFERLVPLGLVAFPNVFEDPSVDRFPQDLFVVESGQIARITDVLRRSQHRLAQPLAHYLAVFRTSPLPIERAILEFDQIAASSKLRDLLRVGFREAFQLASPEEREELGEFRGHVISSSKELAARLQMQFSTDGLFRVEMDDVLSVSEVVAPDDATRYASLCVGQHRRLTTMPEHTLTVLESAPLPSDLLREHGMLVFVATKIG
jgi:SAM-dependent methyltransferase